MKPPVVVFLLLLAYLLLRAPTAEFFLQSLDHGYQLAVGQMVLSGRLQGADFFTLYGPLVGMISAAGLALPGRPAGDVVICAVGYGLSGALIFTVVRRWAGLWWAGGALALMLGLMPRYYKWYYSLMPLAGLAFSARYLAREAQGHPRLWIATLWGGVGGLALLVRLDLGLHAVVYGLFCLLLLPGPGGFSDVRTRWPAMLRFLAGFSLFPAAYAVLLAARTARPLAFVDLLGSMMVATRGVVEYWGSPLPSLRDSAWMTVDGGTWMLYGVVVVTDAFAILVAVSLLRRERHDPPLDAAVLLAFAVGAVGILPQALSRRDLQHLLQTLAPFLLMLPLAMRLTWRLAAARPRAAAFLKSAAVGLLVALATGTLLVLPSAGSDLGPLVRNHRDAWYRLTHLPDSLPEHPVSKTVAALRERTEPGERIFLAMHHFSSPIVVFGHRQIAGLQPVYMPGILTTSAWIQRNVDRLEREPVRVLVVVPHEWRSSPADTLAPYDAVTVTRWRQRYDKVLFSVPGFEIRSH